jgi:hypothetical protein
VENSFFARNVNQQKTTGDARIDFIPIPGMLARLNQAEP